MNDLGKASKIEIVLSDLIGLQIYKAWSIRGTRLFYFAEPGSGRAADSDHYLMLECPWRIERADEIVVGDEDFGESADGFAEPDLQLEDRSWWNLQNQKLSELMGMEDDGRIFNDGSDLIVESVSADAYGGFRIKLSGGYTLSVFPASCRTMEWMLVSSSGRNFALMHGSVSESRKEL
jgi:hypothetical protein